MAVVRCRAPWDRYQVNGQRQWVLFDVAGRQCLCFYRCAWLGLPLATGATVCVYSTVYGRCVLYIMSGLLVASGASVHISGASGAKRTSRRAEWCGRICSPAGWKHLVRAR